MAYFSNGTEGMDWEERNCVHCANARSEDDGGCPITDLHFEFNYEQGTKGKTAKTIKHFLDVLIPSEKKEWGTFAGKCSMFLDKKEFNSEEEKYLEELRFGRAA